MSGNARTDQLVERILDSGCAPEEACRDVPELLWEVCERLQKIRNVEAHIEVIFPSSDGTTKQSSVLEEKLPEIPGYKIEGMLGRGGMGVVYRAYHVKLGRLVALKMLLSGPYASEQELKRFMREAQAVAALAHANIVQIYDAGELDGRPYYTMELMEGGSLAQRLAGTPQPAVRTATLVATLAQAIHTAHERGIVHRDLKPSNILLTREGTPKISDFGLARYFDSEYTATVTEVHLGTPSYMSPEQAVGKTSDIGPTSDVYSLGAILYEMLTGRPPFRGETSAETIQQVLKQEPVPPSRLNERVPRDLQTICLQCLNKDAKRRYASAAALAEDLQRFQRGEPITARPTGLVERAGKWIRRRPTLAAAIAGGIVISAVGIAGALWFIMDRAATVQTVEIDLRQAVDSENHSDWTGAVSALDRAKVRMQDHSIPLLRRQLDEDEQDLDFGQRLESIGLNRTAWVENRFARLFDDSHADAAYSAAFRDGGIASVGNNPAAVAARINQSNVKGALIAALDDWAICVTEPDRRRWLFEVARAADPDPTGWRDRLRDPAASSSRADLIRLADSDAASNQPVRLLAALGERLEDAGAGDAAIAFLRRVQEQYAGDFWANFMLGEALRKNGDCAESVRYYQAAIALRPTSTVAIGNLGMALAADNRISEAEEQFRQEIALDPQSSHAHYSLGLALRRLGRVDDAIKELDKSVRLEPDSANHQYNLGLALVDGGQLDKAVEHFQAALRIDPNYADARYNLGLVMAAKGKNDQAIEQFQQAIKLDPSNAQAYYCLGLALKCEGKQDAAIPQLRKAIEIDPNHADAHYNLGLALMAIGKKEPAIAEFESAVKIDPKQVDAQFNLGLAMMMAGKNDQASSCFQEVVKEQPNNRHAHYLLGLILKGDGKLDEAIVHLQRATQIEPGDAYAHYNLGLGLMAKYWNDAAIAEFQSAIKINPNDPDAHYNLGLVLIREGRNAESVEQFRKTLQFDANNPLAHYYVGLALKGEGKFDAAIQHLQRSIELDPSDPYAHYNLGLGLMATGQQKKAVGELEAALKIDPKLGDAEYNLGLALMETGRLEESIDHFRAAIALNPLNGYAYGGLGNALTGEERPEEAQVALQRCLDLVPLNDPGRQQYVFQMQRCKDLLAKESP